MRTKVKFFHGPDLDKLEKEVNEFIERNPDHYANVKATTFVQTFTDTNMYLITVTLTPVTIVRQIVDDIEMPF